MVRRRTENSLGNGGSVLAGLLVACFAGALVGGLAFAAAAPVADLVVAGWELFWRLPLGWALERLARPLSPLVVDLGMPRPPEWGISHNLVVGAMLPGVAYILHRLRRARWQRRVLQSNLQVAAEVALGRRRAADVDSPQQEAARFLATRGVTVDPTARARPEARSTDDFAAAEAAAADLLRQLARRG